jgi:molecular chaperone DnaK
MSRSTIDFGIDLGTTNSAVAVLKGTITDIIKNNRDNDITPSAVYINKHDQIHTGLLAKNRLEDDLSEDDVYIEFKRRMGTAHKYEFKTAGKVMSPEQLSAELLKGLRGDVQQRTSEDIHSAVITVPAAFEQKQCAATRTAGELAGLYQCPLVQEPVAAALAYGYQSDVTKEYWLIFDFGGGTFDAAIMKAEDGTIAVVNHGGDNYLGGSDIDWAVIEQLIIPDIESEFNLPDFKRGNKRWRTALAKIKSAVELAKIQLSRSDTTYLEGCRIKDAAGEHVEIEYKLTRDSLITVAEPLIARSVDICKRVLKEKNLTPNAIEKVVLVGGPTLAPYFREILTANLGITLDFSVDPLTVVARGAAVFAGTQRIEGKAVPKASAGQYDLELKYKPVGADIDPTVRGAVKAAESQSIDGFTIEFVNQQTHWRSGKIPIKENGRFRVDLLAEKGEKNDFTIELLDATGTRQVSVPDSISYTIGISISEQPIINTISVALANNEADAFFRKGDPLPARATRVYHSTLAVHKGSEDHILNVPVVEGEIELADRNRLLGKLSITGAQVRRDVPAGSEVEVTILMDASRIIRAKAYIPVLDEEYEAVIDYNSVSPDHRQLKREYNQEVERMEALRDKADDANDKDAGGILDGIEASDGMEALDRLLDAAEADPDAANNAEKRLLEVKVALDRAENSLKWPALIAEANTALNELEAVIDQHAPQHRARLDALRKQVDELIEQKRPEALRKKMEQVADLHREVLFERPEFWLGFFNFLSADRVKMRDQAAAERLINQGQQCIQKGNVPGLRNVVAQLLGLLPQEEAEVIRRAYESGVQ